MGVKLITLLAKEFEGVKLGDERLNKRCQEVVKAIGVYPDKSIPQACGDWGSTKAAYRFFDNENVEREILMEPHISATVERSKSCEEILAIQDTTYLNLTGHKNTEGLGPIGTKKGLQGSR